MARAVNYVDLLDDAVFTKEGDTVNSFEVKLIKKDGAPADLTGATVTWSMANNKGKVLEKAAVIDADPTTGQVSLEIADGDETGSGSMRVEIKVEQNGLVEKFPGKGFLQLVIGPSLDNIANTPVSFAKLSYFEGQVTQTLTTSQSALDTANEAKTVAEQSNTKSDTTQSQVDNLILFNGESDAELIQARGDFSLLYERLTDSDGRISNIAINVSNPPSPLAPAIGDFDKDTLTGTDDTVALQAIFDYAKTNNIGRIEFDGSKKYKISNRIITDQDNLEVDLKGAKLYWYNTSNVVNQFPDVRESWVGAIEFSGSEVAGSKVDVTGYQTITEMESTQYETSHTRMGRFAVSDASGFTKGDNLYIRLDVQPQGDYTVGMPVVLSAAKVVKVDTTNNYIFTDYYSPYDMYWGNYNFTDVNTEQYIVKLDAVKNTKIKNMYFEDLNPETQLDFQEPLATDSQRMVSGVANKYGDGFLMENCHMIGTHFGGLETYGTTNIVVRNSSSKDVKYNGPGKGYGIHFYHSTNIVVENWHCQNVRHTVDFSGGAFGTVTNCSGQGLEQFSFTLHGQGEHSITFTNVHGTSKVGHGVLYFADLNANVKYINSTITDLKFSWVDDLSFDHCEVLINGSAYHTAAYEMHLGKVSFDHCKIKIPNRRYFLGARRGDPNYKTKLSFSNCEWEGVDLGDNATPNSVIFHDIDRLTIQDCDGDLSLVNARVNIQNVPKMNFTGNEFTNTYFQWNNSSGITYYNDHFLENNTFHYNDNGFYMTNTGRTKPIQIPRPDTEGKLAFKGNKIEIDIDSRVLEPIGLGLETEWTNSKISLNNEDTEYILSGSSNVDIVTKDHPDIILNALRPIFKEKGTGTFNHSGAFNISQTEVIRGVPTRSWDSPPNTKESPPSGFYCHNVKATLGNNKGWRYTGSKWEPDATTSSVTTIADLGSTTFAISNNASKRGMFFINCSFTSATYAQFVSNGTGQGFAVISKSANVNFDSVIASALNIEMVNGDIKVTNNLGSSRQVTISCFGF